MSDYTSWHVGMEVVFVGVSDDDYDNQGCGIFEVGRVYTISALNFFPKGGAILGPSGWVTAPRDVLYVRPSPVTVWALADAFRPLQKRKTDISVFEALLHSTKQPSKIAETME